MEIDNINYVNDKSTTSIVIVFVQFVNYKVIWSWLRFTTASIMDDTIVTDMYLTS